MYQPQNAPNAYRMNQINNASPLELLILAYDAALMGCNQQDLDRTTRALSVLRNALDFEQAPEEAMGFYRLYQWIGDLARQGKYDEAAELLRELREAWQQVKQQQQPQAAANGYAQQAARNPALAASLMTAV